MTRTLVFLENDEDSKKRFEVVYHGLMIMGNQNTQKGLTVLTRELSILDKLESISKPCVCGKKFGNEPDRELSGDSKVPIDDYEFDLLYDYISRVPWSIGTPSRTAIKTLEWLRNGNS